MKGRMESGTFFGANKRLIINLILLIAGLTLLLSFFYASGLRQALTWAGFIVVAYEVFYLPYVLAGSQGKSSMRFLIALIAVVGFVALIFALWFKHEDRLLAMDGVDVKAVVTHRKWYGGRQQGHVITYSFNYDSAVFEFSASRNTYAVGDTILVRLMPDNPEHHSIPDDGI